MYNVHTGCETYYISFSHSIDIFAAMVEHSKKSTDFKIRAQRLHRMNLSI